MTTRLCFSWQDTPTLKLNTGSANTDCPFPRPEMFARLADAGATVIRYFVGNAMDYTYPSPGQFQLDEIEQIVDMIRAAGLQVYLSNVGLMPKHACGGLATYNGSCTVGDSSAPSGIRFLDNRPDCLAPGHVDPAASREWGHALATRLGPRVSFWSAINEPGGWWAWPPAYTAERDAFPITDPRNYMQRATNEIVIPFTEGVRSVIESAQFVGPEAMQGSDARDALILDEDYDIDCERELYPIVTIHGGYPWDGSGGLMGGMDSDGRVIGALGRIDQDFMPAIAPYLNGREVWWSEGDPDTADTSQMIPFTLEAQRRNVGLVNWHNLNLLFEPGTGYWQPWGIGGDQSFKPNALHAAFAALRMKGRAVR